MAMYYSCFVFAIFLFVQYILLRICQRVKQLFVHECMHVYVFAIREIQQFNRWL